MRPEAYGGAAARSGCTVVIPYREEMTKRHLKVSGDLGKVVFIVSVLDHAEMVISNGGRAVGV